MPLRNLREIDRSFAERLGLAVRFISFADRIQNPADGGQLLPAARCLSQLLLDHADFECGFAEAAVAGKRLHFRVDHTAAFVHLGELLTDVLRLGDTFIPTLLQIAPFAGKDTADGFFGDSSCS